MTNNVDRGSGIGIIRTKGRSFRALLANVADMVTISDRDGKIRYASLATEHVSGFTPEEFMQRSPFERIHPGDDTTMEIRVPLED